MLQNPEQVYSKVLAMLSNFYLKLFYILRKLFTWKIIDNLGSTVGLCGQKTDVTWEKQQHLTVSVLLAIINSASVKRLI